MTTRTVQRGAHVTTLTLPVDGDSTALPFPVEVCPACDGAAVRRTFPTTHAYVSCRQGHVFPAVAAVTGVTA